MAFVRRFIGTSSGLIEQPTGPVLPAPLVMAPSEPVTTYETSTGTATPVSESTLLDQAVQAQTVTEQPTELVESGGTTAPRDVALITTLVTFNVLNASTPPPHLALTSEPATLFDAFRQRYGLA